MIPAMLAVFCALSVCILPVLAHTHTLAHTLTRTHVGALEWDNDAILFDGNATNTVNCQTSRFTPFPSAPGYLATRNTSCDRVLLVQQGDGTHTHTHPLTQGGGRPHTLPHTLSRTFTHTSARARGSVARRPHASSDGNHEDEPPRFILRFRRYYPREYERAIVRATLGVCVEECTHTHTDMHTHSQAAHTRTHTRSDAWLRAETYHRDVARVHAGTRVHGSMQHGNSSWNSGNSGLCWQLLRRKNPSTHLPTDFALIRVHVRDDAWARDDAWGRDDALRHANSRSRVADRASALAHVRACVGATQPYAPQNLRLQSCRGCRGGVRGRVLGVYPDMRLERPQPAVAAGARSNAQTPQMNVADWPRSPTVAGPKRHRAGTRPGSRAWTQGVSLLEWNASPRNFSAGGRRLLKPVGGHRAMPDAPGPQLPPLHTSEAYRAQALHSRGAAGVGVRVGVFDTGLRKKHPHFRNVRRRTNWTNEPTMDDTLGHGTFVAGLIASDHPMCKGMAPDADIYIFRVFTSAQTSYTSWFLDALNYASSVGIHVMSLSVGGPDFYDAPFMDKIDELAAQGIIIVSAIGNDGPLYGTLNNPGDQASVIGVGGANQDGSVAVFSSRGMTTWELPGGFGRVKPDVLAYAESIVGSAIDGGCRTLSGTSVASPVVAGAVALLSSLAPIDRRWLLLSPAAMKQALVTSSHRVVLPSIRKQPPRTHAAAAAPAAADTRRAAAAPTPEPGDVSAPPWLSDSKLPPNMYEQGSGMMHLQYAAEQIETYPPEGRVTAFPAVLDFTDCPYMWPHCGQPLWYGALPVGINATIMNGIAASSTVLGVGRAAPDAGYENDLDHDPSRDKAAASGAPPTWLPGQNGELLRVSVSAPHNGRIWPWIGTLAIALEVVRQPSSAASPTRERQGASGARWDADTIVAEGILEFTVASVLSPEKYDFLLDEAREHHVDADGHAALKLEDPNNRWDRSANGADGAPPRTFSTVRIPIRVNIARRPPPRRYRLLFDAVHSMRYPGAYVPRDDVNVPEDALDWNGDHPFTNLRGMWMHLRDHGYAVEIAGRHWSCYDLTAYGSVLVVDPEDDFAQAEIAALHAAVSAPSNSMQGEHAESTSLIVLADWYDPAVIDASVYHDDNTRSYWKPITGGANIPAVNALLSPFGVRFGQTVYRGVISNAAAALQRAATAERYDAVAAQALRAASANPNERGHEDNVLSLRSRVHIRPNTASGRRTLQLKQPATGRRTGVGKPEDAPQRAALSHENVAQFASGNVLAQFPVAAGDGVLASRIPQLPGGSGLYFAHLVDQSFEVLGPSAPAGLAPVRRVPVLGMLQVTSKDKLAGRVAVFGDSSCVDDAHIDPRIGHCWWLLDAMLEYTREGVLPPDDFLGLSSATMDPGSFVGVRMADAKMPASDFVNRGAVRHEKPPRSEGRASSTGSSWWAWANSLFPSASTRARSDLAPHTRVAAPEPALVNAEYPRDDRVAAEEAAEVAAKSADKATQRAWGLVRVAMFDSESNVHTAAHDSLRRPRDTGNAPAVPTARDADNMFAEAIADIETKRVRAGPLPSIGPHGYVDALRGHVHDASMAEGAAAVPGVPSRSILAFDGRQLSADPLLPTQHGSHVHDFRSVLGGPRARLQRSYHRAVLAEHNEAFDWVVRTWLARANASITAAHGGDNIDGASWRSLAHTELSDPRSPVEALVHACHPLGPELVVAEVQSEH